MSQIFRNILFIFFILSFFILTPIIILYSFGYKINYSWPIKYDNILQKTGMFIFKTKPKNTKIYLNGEIQKNLFNNITYTPAKIKNLIPKQYNIKFELDGYWPWEKKLNIYPGIATNAENIILFKNNKEELLYNLKINFSSISPNKNYIAIIDDNKLNIFDIENNKQNYLASTTISNTKEFVALWSPDSNYLFINNTIYYINNSNISIKINKLPNSVIDLFKWENNNNYVNYINENKDIVEFNINNNETKTIFKNIEKNKILDYIYFDNKIYIIVEKDGEINLNIYEYNNQKIISDFKIPFSNIYSIKNINNNLIAIHDEKNNICYLINNKTPIELYDKFSNIKYFDRLNNDIIYTNDFEIFNYNIDNKNKTFLTRISKVINNVLWMPNKNYIIYSTNNTINSLELDDREKHNIIELATCDKINKIFLNNDSNTIYFDGICKGINGLYKLEI